MRRVWVVFLLLLFVSGGAQAQDTEIPDDSVHVRVVDCGTGLCCIVQIPGGEYLIIDAGSHSKENGIYEIISQVTQLIPQHETIDLLVLSHLHGDHNNALPYIFSKNSTYSLDTVLRTGLESINDLIDIDDYTDLLIEPDPGDVIRDNRVLPGHVFTFGENNDVKLTVVCGWDNFDEFTDDLSRTNDRENSSSIVVKLEYGDSSVLFAGDTLGYGGYDEETETDCEAAEEYMFTHCSALIESDVLIAGHHGSKSSSSESFIRCISPTYVIFSAGHNHRHPTQNAADRINGCGVPWENMFRTDWGDCEYPSRSTNECDYGRSYGDWPGDDHIDIWLRFDDEPIVLWDDEENHIRPEYP